MDILRVSSKEKFDIFIIISFFFVFFEKTQEKIEKNIGEFKRKL